MTEPKSPPDRKPEPDEQDEAARVRALILQRLNRFIAAAIAGLGAAQTACSDSHGAQNPTPSNQQAGHGGQAGQAGRPSVCLEVPEGGTGAAAAGGSWPGRGGAGGAGGAGVVGGSGGSAGTKPQVCLDVDPCWDNRTPPCICLMFPVEDDAGIDDGSQGS
jgi:hypothetical protein